MVRRQEHNHDDDNPNTKGSARGASAGLSLLDKDAALQRPDSAARRFDLQKFHLRIARPLQTELRRVYQKSPPENYGKEDRTTVAAFLPWRGLSASNP